MWRCRDPMVAGLMVASRRLPLIVCLWFLACLPVRSSANFKGCRIRGGHGLHDIVPDFIPGTEVHSGLLKTKKPLELLKAREIEVVPGDGYVYSCRCKVNSSSPIVIQTAIEVSANRGSYSATFAVMRVEILSDMTRKKSFSLFVAAPIIGTIEGDPKSSQGKSSAISVKSNQSKLFTASSLEGFVPTSLSEQDSGFAFFSWSNAGADLTKEQYTSLLDFKCVAY